MKNIILSINADLKYIEFLLNIIDNEDGNLTLNKIREKFEKNFNTKQIFLNQQWGIIRLIPLLLIKETYKMEEKDLTEDVKKIQIIRNSLAHANFTIDKDGYLFRNRKEELSISYNDFQKFLHKIENEFHTRNK